LRDDQVQVQGRHYPTFIEIGSNRARINHRRGSNSGSGEYYWDYDVSHPITHYGQWRPLNVEALRVRFTNLSETVPVRQMSPLSPQHNFRLPRFFTTQTIAVSDLNAAVSAGTTERPTTERLMEINAGLNAEGYWPTPLTATSNPYAGEPPAAASDGDFAQTLVGDRFDTSPYVTQTPVTGISTAAFIQNMSSLLLSVDSGE
jgi:hypothetical protein